MRKAVFILGLLFFVLNTTAQVPANVQKQMQEAQKKLQQLKSSPQYKAAMQKAQQAMQQIKSDTNLQKQMSRSKAQLDSLKKTHPELAGVQLPDINNMNARLPNFDSIGGRLKAAGDKLNEMTQTVNQTVPKKNLFHQADKLPKFTESTFLALARVLLKKATSALDTFQRHALTAMLRDTSVSAAGAGVSFLAWGLSKNAAVYLICHGILKHPKDVWAANDLGAFFRTQMDYEKALQCFFYANNLYASQSKNTNAAATPSNTGAAGISLSQRIGSPGGASSVTINTNIGWAAAYYGDFSTAKKYFEKALAIDGNCSSALEGEANIAFAEGDIAALFQCLAKEVKYVGGTGNAGGSGPSAAFAGLCGGTSALNEGDLDHQSTDPTGDHTFDNPNPDDGHSSDVSPGGQVDDIQYSRYKPVFISDAKQIMQGVTDGIKQNKASLEELKKRVASLVQQLRSMKPLVQTAYQEGKYMIYPAGYRSYVEMLTPIDISFEKRTSWWISKLSEKAEPFTRQVIQRDIDMANQYIHALLACGGDERCGQQVMCTWLPRMYKSKSDDLAYIIKIWNEYYDHTAKAIQWYIDASAPFIYEVKDDEWNQYLNAKREFEVRKAVITAYGYWISLLGNISTPVVGYIQAPVPSCPATKMFASIKAPDPYSHKVHHIYEFKDPNCYNIQFGVPGWLSDEMTCHGEKVSYGVGIPEGTPIPFNFSIGGFQEKITDPLKASDLGYDTKTGFGVSAGIIVAKIVGISGEDKMESTYSDGRLVGTTFTKSVSVGISPEQPEGLKGSGIPNLGVKGGIQDVETIVGSNISDHISPLNPTFNVDNVPASQKDELSH